MRTQVQIEQRRRLTRKRRLARLGRMLAAAAVLLTGGWIALGWLLEPMALRQIRERLGGEVYLDSARWIFPGQIRLTGLQLAADEETLAKNPLTRIEQIDCRLSLRDLLRFRVRILTVTLTKARFFFEYDFDRRRWNIFDLRFVSGEGTGGQIPIVYLREGVLEVAARRGDRAESLTAVGLEGQFVSYRQGGEYRFRLKTAEHLAFADSGIEGVWRRGKGEGQITLDGNIQMPRSQIYGNAWDVRDIRLDCEYSPQKTQLNELSFALGEGQALLRGTMFHEDTPEPLRLEVRFENAAFGPDFRKDTIVYSRSLMEVLDPQLVQFLNRYSPIGRADLHVQIAGRLSDLARSRVEGHLDCRDVTITDRYLPYALEHLTGRILLQGRNFVLENLRARHGEAEFTIRGRMETTPAGAVVRSHIVGANLSLDQDLYRSLDPAYKQLWFAFAPSGRINIDYEFHDSPPEEKLRVDLLGVRAVFDRFPYPLENLTGALRIEGGRIEFENVAGVGPEDRRIEINGYLENQAEPDFDFRLTAENIPIDQTLREAFPKSQRKMLEQFDLTGKADVQMRLVDTERPDREAEITGTLRLVADSVVWKPFPLPLTGVTLNASFDSDRLDASVPAASCGSGFVEAVSTLYFPDRPDAPQGTIHLKARGLPLDETFWNAAAPHLRSQSLWAALRADGTADLDGELSLPSPQETARFVIKLNGNRLRPADALWVSGPATGTVRYEGSRVLLENVSIPDLPVDARLTNLLPDPLRSSLAALDASGRMDLTIHHGQFETDPEERLRASADGAIGFQSLRLPSLKIDDLFGLISGRLDYDGEGGIPEGRGRVDIVQARLLERPISDFSGAWGCDPNSRQVYLPDFSARCCGGRLSGSAIADFADSFGPGRWQIKTSFDRLLIHPLLQAGRKEELKNRDAEGFLDGYLAMKGPFGDLHQAAGQLQFKASELKIQSETTLGRAMTLMGLQKPTDYVFEEMNAEADLKEGILYSPRILLTGKNAVFQGTGHVDLEKKAIHANLTAFGRRAGRKPTLLNTLAENFGAAIARVEISGDLENPIVRKIPLPLFQVPLELLGEALEKKEGGNQ